MAPGQSVDIAGYTMTFKGAAPVAGPNFDAAEATIVVTKGGREIAVMHPQQRTFTQPAQTTTFMSIHTNWFADLYAALGEPEGNVEGVYVTRFYYQPLLPFLWYGALLMFFGGLVSLTDRRHRVGAPRQIGRAHV